MGKLRLTNTKQSAIRPSDKKEGNQNRLWLKLSDSSLRDHVGMYFSEQSFPLLKIGNSYYNYLRELF